MGVVYHANYFVWFEIGRTHYFEKAECPYVAMEKEGVYFPVIESHCKYRHPAHYGDLLIVKTHVDLLKPTRVKLSYKIYREKQLLAEGYTCHAFVSKGGRPLNLKKSHPHLWEKLENITKNS